MEISDSPLRVRTRRGTRLRPKTFSLQDLNCIHGVKYGADLDTEESWIQDIISAAL